MTRIYQSKRVLYTSLVAAGIVLISQSELSFLPRPAATDAVHTRLTQPSPSIHAYTARTTSEKMEASSQPTPPRA